jgi:hypothetical protein
LLLPEITRDEFSISVLDSQSASCQPFGGTLGTGRKFGSTRAGTFVASQGIGMSTRKLNSYRPERKSARAGASNKSAKVNLVTAALVRSILDGAIVANDHGKLLLEFSPQAPTIQGLDLVFKPTRDRMRECF